MRKPEGYDQMTDTKPQQNAEKQTMQNIRQLQCWVQSAEYSQYKPNVDQNVTLKWHKNSYDLKL